MEEKDDGLQTNFGATRCSIREGGATWCCLPPLGAAGRGWAPLGTTWHICTNFATCSWEPPTMLNPHFLAGEHGLFGARESEDIRIILVIILCVT